MESKLYSDKPGGVRQTRFASLVGRAVCGCALAMAMITPAALAIEPGSAATVLLAQEDAVAEKPSYGLAVSASVTGQQEITLKGYTGGRSRAGTFEAMANPKVTVKTGDTVVADAVAPDAGGKVALNAPIAVASYEATVTSDNYGDVTVRFAYPAPATLAVGGASYDYLTAANLQYVDAEAQAQALSSYAQIGETGVYYKPADGSTALSGTLYGMAADTTKYSEFYGSLLGTALSADDYDAVTTATRFTSHHAGDISPLVSKDAESGTILGVCGTPATLAADKVDAYVEASVLKAAGAELTADQQELLGSIALNDNATVDPASVGERVAVDTETPGNFATGYTYFTQYSTNAAKHYGDSKITVRPKAGANGAGFKWADYYKFVYAATLTDSAGNKAGLAPWIDLYAEGGHGAVEIAIADGQNEYAAHEATVNRFAKMYDPATGRLKAGTYTVTIYAAGYNDLQYTFDVSAAAPADNNASIEFQNASIADGATATVASAPIEKDTEVKTYAQDAAVKGGKVALDGQLPAGDYIVTLTQGDATYAYTLTAQAPKPDPVSIAKAKVTLAKASAAYTGKAQKGAVRSVVLDGKALKEGTDYTVSAKSGKDAGSYEVTVTGMGDYTGTAKATFKITAAAQKVTAKVSNKTFKAGKLKKKAASFKIGAKAKTALSYKVAAKKALKKFITVSKAGKVTMRKGAKKGTYKVVITAKQSKNYKQATKTITVKVK